MIRTINYDEYNTDNKKRHFMHNPFPYKRMLENLLCDANDHKQHKKMTIRSHFAVTSTPPYLCNENACG